MNWYILDAGGWELYAGYVVWHGGSQSHYVVKQVFRRGDDTPYGICQCASCDEDGQECGKDLVYFPGEDLVLRAKQFFVPISATAIIRAQVCIRDSDGLDAAVKTARYQLKSYGLTSSIAPDRSQWKIDWGEGLVDLCPDL